MIDALSWKVQSRLAALICAAPTRVADMKAAADWKKEKARKKSEKQEQQRAAESDAVLVAEADISERSLLDGNGAVKLGGARSSAIHSSHRIQTHRGVMWCWRCGKYAISRGRSLLKPCAQGANGTGKAVLSRVRRGLTPHISVRWAEGGSD